MPVATRSAPQRPPPRRRDHRRRGRGVRRARLPRRRRPRTSPTCWASGRRACTTTSHPRRRRSSRSAAAASRASSSSAAAIAAADGTAPEQGAPPHPGHLAPMRDRQDYVRVFLRERHRLPDESRAPRRPRRRGATSGIIEGVLEAGMRRRRAPRRPRLPAGDARAARHVQCRGALVRRRAARTTTSASRDEFARLDPATRMRAAASRDGGARRVHPSDPRARRRRDACAERTLRCVLAERARRGPRRIAYPRQAPRASTASAPGATTRAAWARCAAGSPRSASNAGDRVAIMGDAVRGMDDLRPRGAGARRDHLRHLPHRVGGRSRIPDARRRRVDLHRRGPGVRRQDPAARSTGCPRLALDRRDRRRRDVRLRPSAAEDLRRACSSGAAPAGDPAAALERLARARCRRSGGVHRLHLGHHRPPEGRAGRARPASRRRVQHRRRTTRRSPSSRTARSSTCRCATSSAATSRSRCRCSRGSCRTSARTSRTCRRRSSRWRRRVLFTVPRYLQKFASQVLVGIVGAPRRSSARPTTRRCASAARRRKRALGRHRGTPPPPLAYGVARATVFAPLLNKLGLDRLELAISGGARAAARDHGALADLGRQRVRDLRPDRDRRRDHHRPARAVPAAGRRRHARPTGWEVKLGDDSEILVRSADLFDGYWNNPKRPTRVLDADGWLRTGDVGEWTRRPPADRRPRARLHRHLRRQDAVAVLHRERPAREPLRRRGRRVRPRAQVRRPRWSRSTTTRCPTGRARTTSRTPASPASRSIRRSSALLQGEIDRANAQLARVEQVKRFRILPKALDPEEEGEPVTPTRKVKRTLMYERFRDARRVHVRRRGERLVAAGVGDARCKT